MAADSDHPITDHRELKVWQTAMALVEEIYVLTRSFPSDERYGLTAQLRRCVVSVPSNIAEGAARRSTREFLNFLSIARGSLAELQTQIVLADRLGMATSMANATNTLQETYRTLNGLIKSIESRSQLN